MSQNIIKQKRVEFLPYQADNFSDLFSHVKIQTNNVCTRKCRYCYYGNRVDERFSSDVLSSEVVYKIVDELHELDYNGRISFFEINEPLTDKRIFDFIFYAKKHLPKAWQMLVTNGDLIDKGTIERLFRSGLDRLYISVYDKASMKRICKLRDDNKDLFINIELMDLINEEFLDNRGGHLNNYEGAEKIKKFLRLPCERIYKIIIIRPSGNVVSCFADFYEDNILGNVYKQNIKDIWFGVKYKKLRNYLDKGHRDCSSLCSKCNYKGRGGYFTK